MAFLHFAIHPVYFPRPMFYVYILRSEKTKKYYVGSTQDVANRLREHNHGETRSIRHGIPWALVHQEIFPTRAEAVQCENKIKARGIARYLQALNIPPG